MGAICYWALKRGKAVKNCQKLNCFLANRSLSLNHRRITHIALFKRATRASRARLLSLKSDEVNRSQSLFFKEKQEQKSKERRGKER